MTSDGSGIDNTMRTFRKLYPDVNWKAGKLINGDSKSSVDSWVKSM